MLAGLSNHPFVNPHHDTRYSKESEWGNHFFPSSERYAYVYEKEGEEAKGLLAIIRDRPCLPANARVQRFRQVKNISSSHALRVPMVYLAANCCAIYRDSNRHTG